MFTQRTTQTDNAVGELSLTFEWRQKTRCRVALVTGEEVGIYLERGTVLRDGDRIASNEGHTAIVRAAAEELLHVTAANPTELARIAYHLGNRHVPVQIAEGWLRLQIDHVLEGMVRGLGGNVERVSAPFDPESGAYGHGGHDHHAEPLGSGKHADTRHAPKIHDFVKR